MCPDRASEAGVVSLLAFGKEGVVPPSPLTVAPLVYLGTMRPGH
jgi:hypothetical protein